MKRYLFSFRVILIITFFILIAAIPSKAAWPIPANDWTNQTAKLKYKQVALRICDTFNPNYLALGIGVNVYYQYHPEDFDRFVEVYKDIYDTIKSNPKYTYTKVFVTFQLENMKGLGAAIGYPGKSQWEILKKFDGKLDLLVFTSFPEVEYPTPEELPADYYSSIYNNVPANLRDKKIAFSEIGWNSENLIPITGENNSYLSQVHFIDKFAHLINSLKDSHKVEFVTWTMMHDFKNTGSFHPLRTIGLRDSTGRPKDADDSVWKMWYSFYQFESPAFKIGIGPIPRNFPGASAKDWLDMYKKVPTIASLILSQTDWYDSPQKAGQIPQVFMDLQVAKVFYQADCIYGINFFNLSNGDAKIYTAKATNYPLLIVGLVIFFIVGIVICKIKNCFSFLGRFIKKTTRILFLRKSLISKYFNFNEIDQNNKERYFIERGLSFREQEVFEYLIRGKSYKEIADKLNISVETVKKHASNIYRKTGTTSKSELRHKFWNNLK